MLPFPNIPALIAFILATASPVLSQSFFFGADLSYVNEMEDCGVVYYENGEARDPYEIFAAHNCRLARLRLWHTPAWYDSLNTGARYSGLADVKRSIRRAREAGMQVLLDFHLSDFWADPSRQLAPAAWLGVVDSLPLLQDSLYNYLYNTLSELRQEGLLPEMVQLGNETNRGILLSPEANNAGWVLEWDRNAALFNTGIQAIRDVEQASGQRIRIALHIAGPSSSLWYFEQFIAHGVTDFDIMGISYYWAWHQPTSIEETGAIIAGLRNTYPAYDVMILETAYIWTLAYNDNAANTNNSPYPGYLPVSPQNQKRWLIDLTQTVIDNGGKGVIYWEPAWLSSSCFTPWGQGSHQENAAFFDFHNELLSEGGIGWMEHSYGPTRSEQPGLPPPMEIFSSPGSGSVMLRWDGQAPPAGLQITVFNSSGSKVDSRKLEEQALSSGSYSLPLPALPAGIYFVVISSQGNVISKKGIFID